MDDEAAEQYRAIRDGLLEGLNPNDVTIGGAELAEGVAQADNTAREIVAAELIYLPGEDDEPLQLAPPWACSSCQRPGPGARRPPTQFAVAAWGQDPP